MERQKIENMLIGFTMASENKELPIDDVKLETAVEFYYELVKNLAIHDVVGQSEQLSVAWKALEWVGFTKGEEFTDDDIQEMLNA